jgi:hypothetical protein
MFYDFVLSGSRRSATGKGSEFAHNDRPSLVAQKIDFEHGGPSYDKVCDWMIRRLLAAICCAIACLFRTLSRSGCPFVTRDDSAPVILLLRRRTRMAFRRLSSSPTSLVRGLSRCTSPCGPFARAALSTRAAAICLHALFQETRPACACLVSLSTSCSDSRSCLAVMQRQIVRQRHGYVPRGPRTVRVLLGCFSDSPTHRMHAYSCPWLLNSTL